MSKMIIRPLVVLAMTLSCAAWAAGKAADPAAGTGEAVKAWAPRAYETLTGGFQPLAIYIYDHELKKNTSATQIEGKDGLNNADLKDKLTKFAKIKIKSDATDAKGWPADTLKQGEKGAMLILRSADGKVQFIFTKTEHKLPDMIAAAKAVQDHEDKIKAQAEMEGKKAQALAAAHEKPKEKEPDLTIKVEEKKPEPKKGSKAAADAKKTGDKVAGANAGEMPGDAKKMDGKKAPLDE